MKKGGGDAIFDSYEFTFAGRSCVEFDLMLYDIGGKGQSDVSFGNKAEIVETRTARRVQPLHFGVNYNKTPLEFKLVFGRDRPLDRFEMEDIAYWLTGHQEYQWLTIDQPDLEHVQFRCMVTELSPITNGWTPVAFEATVRCDCPYAYSHPYSYTYHVDGSVDILFRDEGSVHEFSRPNIGFIPAIGPSTLRITNADDGGRVFELKDIPADSDVSVKNASGIIEEANHGYNLYKGFNMYFFRTVHGDNRLHIDGSGELTLSGRFLHNVAG